MAAGPHPAPASGAQVSDAALVAAARGGDVRAKEALFRRHAPLVNGLVYRLLGRHHHDRADVVQECFVEALTCLDSLDAPDAFGSWIGTIAARSAHRKLRRKRLLARLGFVDTVVDPDDMISKAAPPDVAVELRRLYGAIDDLPSDWRVALLLHRLEGWTLPAVAKTLGVSLATVKRWLAHANVRMGSRER